MWHKDNRSETQKSQSFWVHSHHPEKDISQDRRKKKEIKPSVKLNYWSVFVSYTPVQKRGEDDDTQDAEGQDVDDVGEKHLPFTVKAILTLLITNGTQSWNCCRDKSRDGAQVKTSIKK